MIASVPPLLLVPSNQIETVVIPHFHVWPDSTQSWKSAVKAHLVCLIWNSSRRRTDPKRWELRGCVGCILGLSVSVLVCFHSKPLSRSQSFKVPFGVIAQIRNGAFHVCYSAFCFHAISWASPAAENHCCKKALCSCIILARTVNRVWGFHTTRVFHYLGQLGTCYYCHHLQLLAHSLNPTVQCWKELRNTGKDLQWNVVDCTSSRGDSGGQTGTRWNSRWASPAGRNRCDFLRSAFPSSLEAPPPFVAQGFLGFYLLRE